MTAEARARRKEQLARMVVDAGEDDIGLGWPFLIVVAGVLAFVMIVAIANIRNPAPTRAAGAAIAGPCPR